MNGFYQELRRGWYRALRRRSQRRLTWPRFQQLLERFPLPSPSITGGVGRPPVSILGSTALDSMGSAGSAGSFALWLSLPIRASGARSTRSRCVVGYPSDVTAARCVSVLAFGNLVPAPLGLL